MVFAFLGGFAAQKCKTILLPPFASAKGAYAIKRAACRLGQAARSKDYNSVFEFWYVNT